MYDLNNVKSLCDDAFLAVGEKGVAVSGMKRSQLPAAIRAIELNDYTDINRSLSDILGEPVTDVSSGLAKLAAIKEAERQAIVAKGTLLTLADRYDLYAQKIRAIRSYADLTFSGLMPEFILDPEPTGSTIVYMRPGATGDGTSWENAMSDFAAAHSSLSGSKNVIYMEEGTYNATGMIPLKNNIKIYGGFKTNDHSWNNRNGYTNQSVFDAQLTTLSLGGSSTCILDGLTIINAQNTTWAPFQAVYNSKNLIVKDCTNAGSGGGFTLCNNCTNLIAINCQSSFNGGGFANCTNCNTMSAINCKTTGNGGGGHTTTNCNNLLAINCKANSQGGGLYNSNNCTNSIIVNCNATSQGGATFSDISCKNFLVLNCYVGPASIVYNPQNCQNYTVANCVGGAAVNIVGASTLANAPKIYNFVCFNNKTTTSTAIGFYFQTANYYYKLYHCRADASIYFNTNSATNADIQDFSLIQNDNSETKFTNTGTYPVVGNLPYDNNIVNQKYLDGNYGNFNIPQDSVLARAGYWEDGFSFGWDIDGKPRNATHCSIGAFEPNWA